jgi:RNA polymerase sigma factor (TIGR02999 family)
MNSAPAVDSDVTELLHQWSSGHDDAFRELLSTAYNRLRRMASASMRHERPNHTLQPTALVGELYLRLAGAKLAGWKDREHFYCFCARAMRWILTNHAKARIRERHRIELLLPLVEEIRWLGGRKEDSLDLDRALTQLEQIDARKAQILELRIYLGCTAQETAEVVNVSKATVDRDMRLACAWLCRELRPEE